MQYETHAFAVVSKTERAKPGTTVAVGGAYWECIMAPGPLAAVLFLLLLEKDSKNTSGRDAMAHVALNLREFIHRRSTL